MAVGGPRLLADIAADPRVRELADYGKTLLAVTADDILVGVLVAADTLRAEIPAALMQLRQLGLERVELMTGTTLVPQAVRIARRTARTIKLNICFTAGYNAVGLSLASSGIVPWTLSGRASLTSGRDVRRRSRK